MQQHLIIHAAQRNARYRNRLTYSGPARLPLQRWLDEEFKQPLGTLRVTCRTHAVGRTGKETPQEQAPPQELSRS
ncbi:hypothetical protein GCM10010207_48470 [Streptomyces atratus]|nr:hypothetical protein GCM10010207_48470 [Streptomyces atratus]